MVPYTAPAPSTVPGVDFPHKILIPQRPAYLVARTRLTDLLNGTVDRRLIALIAPAGYGKTSLLIDFASTSSSLPICWYTLDRFDEDPWVFLSYLAAAIAQRFPGAVEQTVALLAGRARTSFATAAAAFVRDVYTIGRDFVLIIDDWHLVDAIHDIQELIAQLLLHCPHCHLVLASRIDLSLPDLMLLFARQQLIRLAEDRLRFTPQEVAALLHGEAQAALSPAQAEALVHQSGGWITGILLSLEADGSTQALRAPATPRSERQIYRFLAEQVFEKQAPHVQTFLLDSALLEELTAERCDLLFERNDSGQLLDALMRQHLFITEPTPGVLRYHPLFREFLHEHYRTLSPQGYRAMASRVADAYAAQGQWSLAFEGYLLANDLAAAQRLVAASGEQLYTAGRLETLERWFAALTLDALDASLLCLKARVLLDRNQVHAAQALADLAVARMRPNEELVVRLLQAQIARISGFYDDALAIVQQVLQTNPTPDQRAAALRTLAICHQRLGQIEQAIHELQEALAIERQSGDLYNMARFQYDLGVCYESLGQLTTAEEYYSQADAYWATIGNRGLRAMSLNSRGVVQHLAGRYRTAHATLTTALEHAEVAAAPSYQATVLASLGDLYSDLQLWDAAGAAYRDARQSGGSGYLVTYLDVMEAHLLTRQRAYALATRVLDQLPETTLAGHPITVLLLRGAIACGSGNFAQATLHADAALEQARSPMDVARARLLRARCLAHAQPADTAALVAQLERAAEIADQLGHDAFLVVETLPMRAILRRAVAAGYARAADWLHRHQDLLLAGQMLGQEERSVILTVQTLGTDQISVNGQQVQIGWSKAREVFYYLLARPDGATTEGLREAIWPNLSAERSRDALKTAIYQLRTILPRELIVLQGRQVYRLNREVVWLDYDVERFLQLIDQQGEDPEALLEALDLYHGPYLPDADSNWSSSLRAYLERRYLEALRLAAGRYEQEAAYQDALTRYRAIIAVDPLDEAAHAGAMRCYYALGNRAAAIEQYRQLRRLLDDELGIEPEHTSEVERLYSRLVNAS